MARTSITTRPIVVEVENGATSTIATVGESFTHFALSGQSTDRAAWVDAVNADWYRWAATRSPRATSKDAIAFLFTAKLAEALTPGDTLCTVLRSVSRSGMSRQIDVYALECIDGHVSKSWLSYWAAAALQWPLKRDSVTVAGCGMDMGFHLVYSLASTLAYRVPSIWTPKVDVAVKAGRLRADRYGGYSLSQEWL